MDFKEWAERLMPEYAHSSSIIQLGRACQCTAFPGIRLVAKTEKGVFISVVKNVWAATNPLSTKITTSNKVTSLCYFDLKRHQPMHH